MVQVRRGRSGTAYTFSKMPDILPDKPAIVLFVPIPEEGSISRGNSGDIFLLSKSLKKDIEKIKLHKGRYDIVSDMDTYISIVDDGFDINYIIDDILDITLL